MPNLNPLLDTSLKIRLVTQDAPVLLFESNQDGEVQLSTFPDSGKLFNCGILDTDQNFYSLVQLNSRQTLTISERGIGSGNDAGRGCVKINDIISNRTAEFGFYEYGTTIATKGVGIFEFWVEPGIVSLRSPLTYLTEYRYEARKPVDGEGINMAYKVGQQPGLNGGYVYNSDPKDPLFLKTHDGTNLMLGNGGNCEIGGRLMQTPRPLNLKLYASHYEQPTSISLGYWNGTYNVTDFKISRSSKTKPIVFEMLYGGANIQKNVYIDDAGNWSFGGPLSAGTAKITTYGNISPGSTSAYSLGTPQNTWKKIYVDEIYIQGIPLSSLINGL